MKMCSMIEHKDIESISFCEECKIYMCNKCEKHHSELFKNHLQYKLDSNKEMIDIFIGLCLDKNHFVDLQYFCKTHNKLCCAKCITKIKGKENGQHTDCDICLIEDIENQKKIQLKENIKLLEDLSINLENSINGLKKFCEKINENKEQLKINIQKIFTKIRNELNNIEEQILLELEKEYNNLYFNEEIFKKSEKLPEKIKL